MQAREDFHKAGRSSLPRLFAIGTLALLPWACTPAEGGSSGGEGRALLAESAPAMVAGPPAGHAWVIFGADTVVAEVAATPEERSEGLMYRDEVPDGTGMLFVFQDNAVRSFWMANTYVPLDIGYLDPSFRLVDIVQMEPLVTDSYVSSVPAMYGLEVRQGWFGDNEIGVGAQAEIVFGVPGR
jgi:uncharacterized membrane protein (UPF0127 family)